MASSIDTSTIDETKPVHGTPTTQSVRDNTSAIKTALSTAKSEIESLQSGKLDASAYNPPFLGRYTSLAALQAAYPTSTYGHYAIVDAGGGDNADEYIYDEQDGWILSSSSATPISSTDSLTEGSTNFYFTAMRVLATVLSGFSAAVGTVSSSDTLLQALQKIVGNAANYLTATTAKRVLNVTSTSSDTVTFNSDNYDIYVDYGLTGSGNIVISTANITGTPTTGREIWIWLYNGTANNKTYSFGNFISGQNVLPTNLPSGSLHKLGFIFDALRPGGARWIFVGVA
jgi:hypothetical protein